MKSEAFYISVESTTMSKIAKLRMILKISLGIYFIYMGIMKLLVISDFMSALHGYGIPSPMPLNLIAVFIPALEVICGIALMTPRFWKAAMLILIPLMIAFTGLILWRMNSIHTLENIPRCSVSFDCGCGSGVINACRKIVLNTIILIVLGLSKK